MQKWLTLHDHRVILNQSHYVYIIIFSPILYILLENTYMQMLNSPVGAKEVFSRGLINNSFTALHQVSTDYYYF